MAKKYTEEVAQVHTESGVQQAMHRRSLEDDCPLPAPEELQRFKDIDPSPSGLLYGAVTYGTTAKTQGGEQWH